ncbi:MAG: peptidoglycan-binding protein [Sedimentisphaerales bacterium]|nr:peptidoglycan-binding protein [Sedimentisphaerales bacterium]
MAKYHRCKFLDHISIIALKENLDWKKIWDKNNDLQRLKKRSSANMLYTGVPGSSRKRPDALIIPDKEKKYSKHNVDMEHKFEIPVIKLYLRLRVLKADYKPVKDGTDYTLEISDARGKSWTEKGKGWDPEKLGDDSPEYNQEEKKFTLPKTKDGLIEVRIPPTAQKGKLCVRLEAKDTDAAGQQEPSGNRGEVPVEWDLQIGALNPVMETASNKWCTPGVQQRLNNLGFYCDTIDGIAGDKTKAAIKQFQSKFKLEIDGLAGQIETQPQLQKVHDTSGPVEVPEDD